MKKLYLLFFSLIVTITITPALCNSNSDNQTAREIYIRTIKYPTGNPQARSVISYVDACYLNDIGLFEIYFNNDIGTVTITILDEMQQCIAKYTCNTEMESEVFLNLALDSGTTYTIHILGQEYEGIGYFIP